MLLQAALCKPYTYYSTAKAKGVNHNSTQLN